ncbi:hypothetical protein QW131_12455 [Roseibium salinum]|nr:hypothetical protein [Roseibium salinum]
MDEARSHLETLIEQDPSDLEAVIALGNILRAHEIYADAEAVYTKGLDTIDQLEKGALAPALFPRHCP